MSQVPGKKIYCKLINSLPSVYPQQFRFLELAAMFVWESQTRFVVINKSLSAVIFLVQNLRINKHREKSSTLNKQRCVRESEELFYKTQKRAVYPLEWR